MARILLIDDDRDMSHLTSTALMKKGHEVLCFQEAKKGIEEAKRQKPHLILMDVMLPGMDGGQAVKQLKMDPDLKDVPVVFLTALVSADKEGPEEVGIKVDGLTYKTLGKPYEIEQLLKTVEDIVRK
ncbi:MAG: response regulator [Candidatus Omnitrophica bacterium]|nr:response regulator [Candidatus Omnitrophota bacterium]